MHADDYNPVIEQDYGTIHGFGDGISNEGADIIDICPPIIDEISTEEG